MKTNQILAVAAVALLALSAWTYRDSVLRAERFERGQSFLPNLNPDEVATIAVSKGGDETLRLRRQDDRFILASANGYPARNDAVNRFIEDVLELRLEKEVGEGESLATRLGLVAGEGDTLDVAFEDAAGKGMVRFLVGEPGEGDASGSYVQRVDADQPTIYLTSSRVYLSTDADGFVKKEIVDVARERIVGVRGADYALERQDGELTVTGLTEAESTTDKANQLAGLLSGLRHTRHHLADAAEVQGLRFDDAVEVDLDDQSGYRLEVASREDQHFLRISATHDPGQLRVALDADEDEVRETSEVLVRNDEVRAFNAFHGSWIYEVSDLIAERVRTRRSDLVESS